MKMYYCEDRSAGNTGKDASPRVCNSVQLFELTDWVPEELDQIMDLDVSDEMVTETDKVYVRRLV